MISMVPTRIDSLDAAAMSTVFGHMKPSDLASSASVSRDWASLASDDRLWAAAYGSLDAEAWRANTQHQSAALRSGLGSWKQLCKWRSLAGKRSDNRLWVESEVSTLQHRYERAGRGKIVTLSNSHKAVSEVTPSTGPSTYGLQQGAHGTWSPDGKLIARTTFERRDVLGGAFAPAVELLNERGRLVTTVSLESPYPPTSYCWSPCGTRLAMLSGWHHRKVVLRVMEVPQLPVALEALGNAGEALWAARRVTPRMALLCTARPLSFTWTPDGRGIVALVGGRNLRHFDVDAALVAEAEEPDGSSGTGFEEEVSSDTLATAVLLKHPRSLQPEVMVASGSNEGWTVRTAIMNNPASRSTESFTIPAPPMHSELVPHGRGKLRVVTSPDRQSAALISGGMSLDIISFTAAASSTSGQRSHIKVSPLVQHCPGLLYPDMAYGHILAAYWSPDSSRLLTYNDCSFDGLPAQRAWIVWELVDGRSVFSHGPVHLGSGHFESSHLSMLDEHAQVHQLWSPTSDAFCFCAWSEGLASQAGTMPAGQDGARDAGEVSVFVQSVPRWADGRASEPNAAETGDVHVELPRPVEVTSGSLAWWAPN